MEDLSRYNVASKPGDLQYLLKYHVAENTHLYVDPSKILKEVIDRIKTLELLSEIYEEYTHEKMIENWKSAIDAWFERLMVLVSDSMPEKCFVGVNLIGFTCQKCSSDRFLESYAGWFQKLYTRMQELEVGGTDHAGTTTSGVAASSHILQHASYVTKLISAYFKKCTLPELREKFYSVIISLLTFMGNVVKSIGQEVVDDASKDLNPEIGTGDAFGNFHLNETKVYCCLITGKGSVLLYLKHEIGGLVPKNHRRVLSAVKIAALKALRILLLVAMKAESWRSKVDALFISVATSVMEERCLDENNRSCLPNEPASVQEELQIAALDALWASLLLQGRNQTGKEFAAHCTLALLSIEMLTHSRVPLRYNSSTATQDSFGRPLRNFLADDHTSSMQPKNAHSSGQRRQGFGFLDSDDDELYKNHLHSDNDGDNLEKNLNHTDESPDRAEKLANEIPLVRNDSGKAEMALSAIDVGAAGHRIAEEIMIDSLPHEDASARYRKLVPNERILIPFTTNAEKSVEHLSVMDVSAGEVNHGNSEVRLDGHAMGSKDTNAKNLSAASKITTTLHLKKAGNYWLTLILNHQWMCFPTLWMPIQILMRIDLRKWI